ncbi:MAG: hypothetical protein IH919_05505 [Deltaproteobacteria bacterium]|nr:hypothetical protein [Deltaproteobacteria bacterium]
MASRILLAFNFPQVYYLEKPLSIQLGRAAMPNKTISHVNMQQLATFVILLAMSPVLLVLVVVSTTYLLRILLAISGILE